MTRNRPHWLAILVSALLTGCSIGTPLAPASSPIASPPGAWTIELTESGGFAGVLTTIRVSSDGRFSAEDGRSGRHQSGTLTPASRTNLTQLVSDSANWTSPSGPSGCADCFVYDLEFVSGHGTARVHADDASLVATGAQAVIALLRQIREDALSATQ